MKWLALLVCLNVHAQAYMFKTEVGYGAEMKVSWQTCFVVDGEIRTAFHGIDGRPYVFDGENWMKCDLVRHNNDAAVLRVVKKLKEVKMDDAKSGDEVVVHCSLEGHPVEQVKGVVTDAGKLKIKLKHGCSGAPVMVGKKCVGMITTIGDETATFLTKEELDVD